MERNFLEDLFDSYTAACKDISSHREQESKHWKDRNSFFRSKYYNENLHDLSLLKNFRFDKSLSKGLDDALVIEDIPNTFFRLLKEVGEETVFSNLSKKNIGNCNRTLKIDNKHIEYNELFQIYVYDQLNKSIFSKDKVSSVCEIGGGYGSLTRILKSNHDATYILIDLPEANLLSSYYLHENFKGEGKKFLLYNQVKNRQISKNMIDSYDFIIIPPWLVFDDDIKIDLFINSRSMMEMNMEVIINYFHLIQSHVRDNGYFLNINRYQKKTVGMPIDLVEYPYDKKWEVLVSKKTIFFNHIHFLLTQRKNPVEKSIQKELQELKQESKKYIPNPILIGLKKLTRSILLNLFPRSFLKKAKSFLLSVDPE